MDTVAICICTIIILILVFYLYFFPCISWNKAKHRIDNLTMNDFSVDKIETIKKFNTKDFNDLVEVRKDKNGKIYYFINGVLYSYGNTSRITLEIVGTESKEQVYRITKKQYEDFKDYIKGVDSIEVIGSEIHFALPAVTINKNKLHVKEKKDYYIGRLLIPFLNEDVGFTDDEIERIFNAIKEELKEEERRVIYKSFNV